GAGRHSRRDCEKIRSADPFHRCRRSHRRSGALQGRRVRPRHCRTGRGQGVIEAMSESSQAKDGESWEEIKPQLTKLALELGPLVVFFLFNAQADNILAAFPVLQGWFSQGIILATAVFMVAMAISLLISKLVMKRIPVMPLVTGAAVLIFGSLTLFFQDELFIKIKPTITNVLFGSILL